MDVTATRGRSLVHCPQQSLFVGRLRTTETKNGTTPINHTL